MRVLPEASEYARQRKAAPSRVDRSRSAPFYRTAACERFFPLLFIHDIVLVKKSPGVVKPGGVTIDRALLSFQSLGNSQVGGTWYLIMPAQMICTQSFCGFVYTEPITS